MSDTDKQLEAMAKELKDTRKAYKQALSKAKALTIKARIEGESQLSIANRLKVSRTTVRAWLYS